MEKYIKEHKQPILFILGIITVWRLVLLVISFVASLLLSPRSGFFGPTVWANFDGVHYLSIAQNGYYQYEQAFFPLFPLLIRIFSFFTFENYLWSAMILVHIFLFIWLFFFYKLLRLDFSETVTRWILIFSLVFPTSFYFGAVYTETLFLFLVVTAFYAARKEKWLWTGVCIGLASATKLIGIFLLPAVLLLFYTSKKKNLFSGKTIWTFLTMCAFSISGLVSYMVYLWQTYKDPLFFIHAQPAFGANRTGGEIILLPQVLYRYFKIFITVPFTNYDIWIAFLEFFLMVAVLSILALCMYQRKVIIPYILFSVLAVVGPTLTGTLSSVPRYALVAFPIFIFLGLIKNVKMKVFLLLLSGILGVILLSYFVSGYFIA